LETKLITTISGIPCRIKLLHYDPGTPAYRGGHPDNWEPEEGGDIAWEVCDRRGRPAPWLARKLTAADNDRIESELLESIT
jgi:hypothetical protein